MREDFEKEKGMGGGGGGTGIPLPLVTGVEVNEGGCDSFSKQSIKSIIMI